LKSLKVFVFAVFFIFSVSFYLFAADFFDGNIRLVINERNGGFSLYYLTDERNRVYEPLFYDREPKSSLLAVHYNGKVHNLGRTNVFRTRVEREGRFPVIVYESDFLTVRKIFTPVRTANSQDTNGFNITITVTNKGDRNANVGLRFIVDTHLGENEKNVSFLTNKRIITSETRIDGRSGELYWISRHNNLSLMGSIVDLHNPDAKVPDYVDIANWSRLYNAHWLLLYSAGRSFSNLPYSFNDSAVCYYYNPEILEKDRTFTYSIFLTTEDIDWYTTERQNVYSPFLATEDIDWNTPEMQNVYSPVLTQDIQYDDAFSDTNLLMLYRLQEILNQFINGEIYLNENDLADIEKSIETHKARFNLQ
jgi:hypothetical protein